MLQFLLACTLAGIPLQTPPPPPAPAASPAPPRLKVDPPGRQDLGSVGPRQIVTKTYTFTNTSDAPIRLRLLDLSPGMMAKGPALEAPVPPKGSARLEVTVDPTGFVFEQKRTVKLGTDDPGQGNYFLPISLAIRPDLAVDALKKSFGTLAPHESPQVSFRFARETGDPAVVKLVSPVPSYLEADLRPGGSRVELLLTFRPDKVEPGVERGLEHLKVETNALLQPVFDLYVDWRLQHPIEAMPARIVILDPAAARAEVRLRARNGRPFRIQGAKVEGSGFALEPALSTESTTHSLVVLRTSQGPTRALLVVNIPHEAPLRIPLAFLPPPKPAEPRG